jgi:OmpA-OmpF porin, OOP family
MRCIFVRFCLLVLLAPLAASAGDEVGHWYVSPYLGGISPDKDWAPAGSAPLYGFDVGKNFSPAWSGELDLNGSSIKLRDEPGHFHLYGGALDVLRVFNRGATFAPYVSLGAGVTRFNPSSEQGLSSHTNFMVQGGVGVFIKLWENADASRSFALRPDIKARWTDVNSSPVDLLYVLGLTFTFGPGRAPPPAAVAAPPAPPPPPPPPAKPASRCPETPPGVAVDEYGCPIKGDVVLEGVNFETDSAVLTAASKPILDQVAKGLREHPRLRIEVQGHTDSTGSARHNLGLSERRADAVRDYLKSQGVPAAQMTAKGFGETQPVASNATAEGRAKNRRVVMHVLDNPGDVTIHREGEAQQ